MARPFFSSATSTLPLPPSTGFSIVALNPLSSAKRLTMSCRYLCCRPPFPNGWGSPYAGLGCLRMGRSGLTEYDSVDVCVSSVSVSLAVGRGSDSGVWRCFASKASTSALGVAYRCRESEISRNLLARCGRSLLRFPGSEDL